MTPQSVGRVLIHDSFFNPKGFHQIVAYNSPTSVDIYDPNNVFPTIFAQSFWEMNLLRYVIHDTIGTLKLGFQKGDKIKLEQAAGEPVGANDGAIVTLVDPASLTISETLTTPDAVKYKFRAFRRT
jgi:hypothetical protein